MPATTEKVIDALGTGRRKTSVARVRIRPGNGKLEINGSRIFSKSSRTATRSSPRWNMPPCAAASM
jgi:ribosomal protein S9